MPMMTDVTGNSDMTVRAVLSGPRSAGRGWQAVLAAGLSVLTAATVTAFVRTGDPADADTRLASVRNALLVTADGTETPARIGDLVPPGATVRTGPGGGARLRTSGRDVHVGALSTVTVTDGVRQDLSKGQVMVDTRKGPRLELGTQAGTVRAGEGALARVERGASLRLAVLDGAVTFTAAGRKATSTVREYYQVRVPYGAVAGRATAMALTPHDRWERDLAADLVLADTDLNRFALSLDGVDGVTVLAFLGAGHRPTRVPGAARSERALAAVLAEAAGRADSLDRVIGARAEGGSWGVVAAIVGASVNGKGGVSALLDRLLAPAPVAASGPVTAGPVPDLSGLLGGTPAPGTGPGRVPAGSGPTTSPTTPTTSPTPTQPVDNGPPDEPDPVTDLLDTVLNLVASPTPSPSRPLPVKPPTLPLPVLTPLVPPLSGLHLGG